MPDNLIKDYILKHGFMPLDTYMQMCLQHETCGYYRVGNPIGGKGDFITAPEISQIFGELIGVFIDFNHAKLFENTYQICELGGGRGTLAADYLRVLKHKPDTIFCLETNDYLKQQQILNVPHIQHISDLSQLPPKHTLFLANEFFDALPIKAFKLFQSQQAEVIITLDTHDNLQFDYADPVKNTSNRHRGFYETSQSTLEFCQQINTFIKNNNSAFLCCDYGYDTPLHTMTFRGFKNHQVTNGLETPFHEDLTADVDFITLMNYFHNTGNVVYNLMTQANFLNALYIDRRLHQLLRKIDDNNTKQQMIMGVQKLLHPSEMGERFKFLFVSHANADYYPFSNLYQPTETHNANS